MKSVPTINFFLDKRKKLTNGKYPVKLVITYKRKTRRMSFNSLLNQKIELTENEYKAARDYTNHRKYGIRRKDAIHIKEIFDDVSGRSKQVIKLLDTFSFEAFKKELFNESDKSDNIVEAVKTKLKELSDEQFRTKESYYTALKSILRFRRILKTDDTSWENKYLSIHDITEEFLRDYVRWAGKNGLSPTTVGIYLRNIRHLINNKIKAGIIAQTNNPFLTFKIPRGRTNKYVLNLEEILKLNEPEYVFKGPCDLARDFFMLSFYLNGWNLIDIITIRNSDIKNEFIEKSRIKTINNTKKLITNKVFLREPALEIINKYRSGNIEPKDYVFGFLASGADKEAIVKVVRNLSKRFGKNIKKVARDVGVNDTFLFKSSRDSFATIAENSGLPKEYIQRALNHSNISTTESYLAGLYTDKVKSNSDLVFSDIESQINKSK